MRRTRARKGTRRAERGQALILIVFAIVALVGITGLVVDGGNSFADRRRAQNAADSAALAGALARINGQRWVDTIYAVAAENGYDNNGATNSVHIDSPPVSGPYKDNIQYIQVRITSRVHTYFAPVVGMNQIVNNVEAIARSKPPILGPMFGGAAVVSLAPTSDCDQHLSFIVQQEATLDITGGGVIVNSNNPDCALKQLGNGSIRINDGYPLQVVGGFDIKPAKQDLFTPFPPAHALAMPYPPPIFMPKVGCGDKEASIMDDGHTMTAGNWGSDDFPPPDVNALEGGVYCLDGNFVLGGGRTLTGGGVLIYMKRGQFHVAGDAQIALAAKGAGDLAGLLIYQPIDNKNDLILNAGEGSEYKGAILAPGATIRIKGNDSKYGFHSQLIGYMIDAEGISNVIIKYVDDQNWDAVSMPEVQLVK